MAKTQNIILEEYESVVTQKKSYLALKRTFDIVFSVLGIIASIIPMVIIFLLIKIESPGPAIYVHKRVGKHGKTLPLLKFRSMHIDADKGVHSWAKVRVE